MTDIAIKVENLFKRYWIGLKEEMHDTLTGAITSWIKSPFVNYRRVRKLTTFEEDQYEVSQTKNEEPRTHKTCEASDIIDRNGAGKSTRLRILSRISEPTEARQR